MHNIKYSFQKYSTIIPCSRISCLCIEYLDLKKKDNQKFYNFCIKNNLKKKGFFDDIPYTDFYKQNI